MVKDKGKGKLIDEDPPSANETPQAEHERVVTAADYEEEAQSWDWRGDSWDWRNVEGIIRPTLDQGEQATCWACSTVRSVQALYNIGIRLLREQRELSVQHLANNVNFDLKEGITNTRKAFNYIQQNGVCSSDQCKQLGNVVHLSRCRHGQEVHYYDIDGYETITDVDDVTLEDIVRAQPVVAILPLTGNFESYGQNRNVRIYESQPASLPERFHAVLIIGYGNLNGRPYWIIQNSWGTGWGFEGGFGYIYRQTKRGRVSIFTQVHYPTKKRRDGD